MSEHENPDVPNEEQQASESAEQASAADRLKKKWRVSPLNQGPARGLEEEESYPQGRRGRDLDDEIERELAEAMGDASFDDILNAAAESEDVGSSGPRKKGTIIQIHGNDVFVEIPGGRSQGLIPLTQFDVEDRPQVGDVVECYVTGAVEGMLTLSLEGAAEHADWSTVNEGMIVEARVLETNKGGLSVNVNGIRGFMPISQIDLYRVENAETYVNQRLKCVVTEANREDRNLVVSRRALLEKDREEKQEKLWQTLEVGQIYRGVVGTIKDFGAFVDIGGVDGLLPVGEISWTRINHPSDVLEPGQPVEVKVVRIDESRRRLSLSLKQLMESPWETVRVRYGPGTRVEGKVTKIMDFGAFVELEPGVEGLVHISELALFRVNRVNDVVQVGQDVEVMVLSIDEDRQRISLSLKATQVEEKEEEEAEEEEDYENYVPPKREKNQWLRGGVGNTEVLLPEEDENEDER